MPTTLPRQILLLPLLFLLGFLYPWQVQHSIQHNDYTITKGQNDATQQLASTAIGAIAGGGTGAATGLQGEKFNRQLHQKEIDWINKNAAAFATQHPGMSVQQARALLTRAALGLVDNSTAHGNSRLIRRGVIDGQTYRNAQNFIKGHTVGATYHESYDDQPQRGTHSMFTATEYEKNHHYYDPNTAHGGLIDTSLDFIPVGRGISNVVKGVRGAGRGTRGAIRNPTEVVVFKNKGVHPKPGTRIKPEGVPDGWRISNTNSKGGTMYTNPKNPNEQIRIMQGNPTSKYPNSQNPYARQRDASGSYLNSNGKRVKRNDPTGHIPLEDFKVNKDAIR